MNKVLRIFVILALFAILPLFYCSPASAVAEESTLVKISTIVDSEATAGSMVVTGIAPADTMLYIVIDGSMTDTVNADSSGNWTYAASGLSVGDHTIQAFWIKNAWAFISNLNDKDISVISTLTDQWMTDFSIDPSALLQDVVVTPDHLKAYVLDSNLVNSGGVWVVDVEIGSVNSTPLDDGGTHPYAAVSSITGDKIYIVNHDSNNLSIINTVDDSVDAPYELLGANEPVDIAVEPIQGVKAYIANYAANNILIVDLTDNTVVNSINTAGSPNSIVFSPDGTRAYVAETCNNCTSNAIVEVIDVDTDAVIDTIGNLPGAADKYPQSIDITPDGLKVLFVDYNNGTVSIIDTTDNSLAYTLEVGTNPTAVAVNIYGTKAYVVNRGSDNVSVVDLINNSVVSVPISVGSGPNGLGLLEDLYYSHQDTFEVVAPVKPPVDVPVVEPITAPVSPVENTNWVDNSQTVVAETPTTQPSAPVVKEVVSDDKTNNSNNTVLANSDNDKSSDNYWFWFFLPLLILLIIYIAYKIYKKIKE